MGLGGGLAAAGSSLGVAAGSYRGVSSVIHSGDVVMSDVLKDAGKRLSDPGQHALVFGTASFQRHSFCNIIFQIENKGRLVVLLRTHAPVTGFGST